MGPLTRYVEDAAAMLDVMAGRAKQDEGPNSCLSAIQESPKALRIRLLSDTPLGEMDPEILGNIRKVADILRSLGHQVDETPPPQITLDEFLPIWQYAISSIPTLSDRFVQPITRWIRSEGRVLGFEQAEATRQKLALRIKETFADADILMSATVPIVAPLIGSFSQTEQAQVSFAKAATLGSLTAGFNLTQGPAATLPIALTKSGLPIGLQIGGQPGNDHLILSLSRQIEKLLPWHERSSPNYG